MSASIIKVEIPKISSTNNLYEVSADTLQLQEGVILLDIMHRIDHSTLQHLNIPVLNANNNPCSISKTMPTASMHPVGKCEGVQEVSWSRLQCDTSKLFPQLPQNISLQLEPDTKSYSRCGHFQRGQD